MIKKKLSLLVYFGLLNLFYGFKIFRPWKDNRKRDSAYNPQEMRLCNHNWYIYVSPYSPKLFVELPNLKHFNVVKLKTMDAFSNRANKDVATDMVNIPRDIVSCKKAKHMDHHHSSLCQLCTQLCNQINPFNHGLHDSQLKTFYL